MPGRSLLCWASSAVMLYAQDAGALYFAGERLWGAFNELERLWTQRGMAAASRFGLACGSGAAGGIPSPVSAPWFDLLLGPDSRRHHTRLNTWMARTTQSTDISTHTATVPPPTAPAMCAALSLGPVVVGVVVSAMRPSMPAIPVVGEEEVGAGVRRVPMVVVIAFAGVCIFGRAVSELGVRAAAAAVVCCLAAVVAMTTSVAVSDSVAVVAVVAEVVVLLVVVVVVVVVVL